MASKQKPIITLIEILCLAIQAADRKLHECDEMVDRCDSMATQEIIAKAKAEHEAIWVSKLEALKEMYRIETGTNFN